MSRLRELRKEKGLTQEEAARLLGVTRRTYVSYEAGKIDETSRKYQLILDVLEKTNIIDEEHGVLTLDKIKSIVCDVLKDYPETEYCYLFGSYAKKKAAENSDVDLLVSMPIDGMMFFELVEVLSEKLKKKVDLLDVSELEGNLALTKEILRDGVRVYG